MKKFKLAFLILIGTAVYNNVEAAERQPDSNGDNNYFYTSDYIGIDPSTGLGTIDIRLDNVTANFNSYQFDLYLPEGFEITTDTFGNYNVTPNNGMQEDSKTTNHVATVSYNAGFYRIIAYSMSLKYILPGDGTLLTIAIKAPVTFDYNNVVYAQIKNIKFAAGTVSHVFPNLEVEMEDPIPVTLATGDEEMWDKEWKKGALDFPIQFLLEADNGIAEIEDSDVSFTVTPLFEASMGTDSSVALTGNDNEKLLNLTVSEPGLYEVSVNVAKGKRYVIDGKKYSAVKIANIYPSLDGLKLSYESMEEGGAQKEFTPSGDNEIQYQFEIVEGTVDWYHENAKNPTISINESDVEIWYRLDGLDDVTDLTPGKTMRAPANPETNGYSQVTEDGNIYVGKLAFAPENTVAEMSFILKKNGAATPLLSENSEGKSEQIVTIRKSDNVETGIEDISATDNSDVTIYTPQGICLKRHASQEDIDALAPGIYIIGGKKVIVK